MTENGPKQYELPHLLPPIREYWKKTADGMYERYISSGDKRIDDHFKLNRPEERITEKEYFKRKLKGEL